MFEIYVAPTGKTTRTGKPYYDFYVVAEKNFTSSISDILELLPSFGINDFKVNLTNIKFLPSTDKIFKDKVVLNSFDTDWASYFRIPKKYYEDANFFDHYLENLSKLFSSFQFRFDNVRNIVNESNVDLFSDEVAALVDKKISVEQFILTIKSGKLNEENITATTNPKTNVQYYEQIIQKLKKEILEKNKQLESKNKQIDSMHKEMVEKETIIKKLSLMQETIQESLGIIAI